MSLSKHTRREAIAWMAGTAAAVATGCANSIVNRSVVKRDFTMSKHPNLQVIENFFSAYASKDVGRVRQALAPDIVWKIPGHHPLAGEKRGVDEVLAFFDQLAKANFKAEPIAVVADGDYVIDHHRGWSEASSGLDITWCLVFKFEKGRIKEVTNFAQDQHKADLFFWSVYRLKPIPDRLA